MKSLPEKVLFSRSFSYFLQLVETMNYTQAAQLLGISQPALTQQIKKLEASIGAPLFTAIGKKIYLTDAGRTMHESIQEVSNILEEATEKIQRNSRGTSGQIRIGISASVEEKVFTDFIVSYFKRFPEVEITLLMVSRKEILENLENNRLDLAILYLPGEEIQNKKVYETNLIMRDELLFLHHDQNLCKRETISYEEALKHTWVTYPKSYFVSRVINHAFRKHAGKLPDGVAHFTKPSQIFKFSSATEMCTALPRSFFQAHESEGKLHAIPFTPAIDLNLSFVYRREKLDLPRVKYLLEAFNQFLEEEDYLSRLKKIN